MYTMDSFVRQLFKEMFNMDEENKAGDVYLDNYRTSTEMRTRSGRWVDLLYPMPEVISLQDIAHHLSLINRWNGATYLPLSVATHSMNVADDLKEQGYSYLIQLDGLLHDAHETYLGDISRPTSRALVAMLGSDARAALDDIKTGLDVVIYAALGVPYFDVPGAHSGKERRAAVKAADDAALAREFAAAVKPIDKAYLLLDPVSVRYAYWKRVTDLMNELGLEFAFWQEIES